jgi:cystathionine beta-lyase
VSAGARSPFDAITADALRRTGGLKWTAFPGSIGAFVAEMDFGTAAPVTAALHEAVDAGQVGYLPERISRDMSEATAAWQSEHYGWEVPAEWVHPIADVMAAAIAAADFFSPPGSAIIVPTPAYMPFLMFPAVLGRPLIQVPLPEVDGRYTLDLEAIERAFGDGGGILLLTNPFNPVGRVFERDELVALAEVVERCGGRVFSDEIHAPLVYGPHRHVPYASVSPAAAAHTVTGTSASKAWNLPGLKCAQLIVSNPGDQETWLRVGRFAEHGASTLGVLANTAAYRKGEPWLGEVLDYLDGSRHALGELLAEHAPGLRYRAPEGTYIAWLDARDFGAAAEADALRETSGVALTDGTACGAPGFLRLVFATPRPVLEDAVRRIGAALRGSGSAAGTR